jgi:outer membrane protein OmpA-like peptidoglycan-associated protein
VRGRRLRAAGAAGVAAAALAAPAAAQDATVGQVALEDAVRALDVESSVRAIDVEESVIDLQTERKRGDRVTVTVAADVLFEFDRARVTRQARVTIGRVARRIRAAGGPVRVDGHTDGIGSSSYNLALSRRRAAAVSEALQSDLPGVTVSSRGHGEADPVAPNTVDGKDNPSGRALNRRVTIEFPRAAGR